MYPRKEVCKMLGCLKCNYENCIFIRERLTCISSYITCVDCKHGTLQYVISWTHKPSSPNLQTDCEIHCKETSVFFMSAGWSGPAHWILFLVYVWAVPCKNKIPSCTNRAILSKLCILHGAEISLQHENTWAWTCHAIPVSIFRQWLSNWHTHRHAHGHGRHGPKPESHKAEALTLKKPASASRSRIRPCLLMGPILYPGELTWEGITSPFAFGNGNYKDLTTLFIIMWLKHTYTQTYISPLSGYQLITCFTPCCTLLQVKCHPMCFHQPTPFTHV